MSFKDLREFIAKLEKEGEAQPIEEEVDWNLEAGAILRRCHEQGLPAPFFQKIKDYPEGYRIFGGPLCNFRRMAISMEMNPNTHQKELMEEYLRRKQQPIKPILVNDGPCKENIRLGDKVDLLEFPVPLMHDGDGGRYIGTFHLTITKDLDSDWVNWGMYRHMVHNKNTIGINARPHTHLGTMYYQSYKPRNRPMEVAVAIGTEPISAFVAASSLPYGVSEVDIAGGIRGEPVELIKCETVDLNVPATAEIVIEGEMRADDLMDEGPFGEYTGYMFFDSVPRPTIHVKAVTYRDNPILTMSCVGIPVDDNAIICVTSGAELLAALRVRGIPVSGVCLPPETGGTLAVVAVKNSFANIAGEVAHIVWANRAGAGIAYLIVVDDDVDPSNMAQVLHAVATKCHPYRGIVRLEHTIRPGFAPWANRHERQYGLGARVYFDCLWPLDWDPSDVPTKVSFSNIYPLDVQQKALTKLQKYGY